MSGLSYRQFFAAHPEFLPVDVVGWDFLRPQSLKIQGDDGKDIAVWYRDRRNLHFFGDGDGNAPIYESVGIGPVVQADDLDFSDANDTIDE